MCVCVGPPASLHKKVYAKLRGTPDKFSYGSRASKIFSKEYQFLWVFISLAILMLLPVPTLDIYVPFPHLSETQVQSYT